MGERIIVAMSGGVDSSVCAAILKDAGYDVIGVMMRLGDQEAAGPDGKRPTCCGIDGILDARHVAAQLDIPFYAVNYEAAFAASVVDYFTAEYQVGRTPNPCILCNKDLKFGALLDLADDLGAERVATGHYARIGADGSRHTLSKGVDAGKDQSYVLFPLTQSQLARTVMPLGELGKPDVRALAQRYGLSTATKPESQEICFIPDDDYKRFLKDRLGDAIEPGNIVDESGTVLGEHAGTPFYTVGQRRGLGIAAEHPLYVTEIHAADRTIVVGSADALLASELVAADVNWVSIEPPDGELRATVKIRYRDAGALATVTALPDGRARVRFDEPRRAVTPGQAAVLYRDDLLLGGGWIESASAPLAARIPEPVGWDARNIEGANDG